MTCQHIKMPGGGSAIICGKRGRQKRCACNRSATLMCDWKAPKRKSGTCDEPLCDRCTTSPAPDKDLCPEHAKAYEDWRLGRL